MPNGKRQNVKTRGRKVPGLYRYVATDGTETFSFNITIKGERHSGTLPKGTTEAKAIEFLTHKRSQANLEAEGRPNEAMGFRDFIETVYLPYKKRYGVKVEARQTMYDRLAEHFDNKLISTIRPVDISRYLDSLVYRTGPKVGQMVSANTQNHYRGYLSAIFQLAFERELVRENPVRRVKRFDRRPGDQPRALGKDVKRYLSPIEYLSLLRALPPDVRALVEVAANTGMRAGELLTLQWGQVDPDFACVHLKGELTKSGKDRTVYLNEGARRALGYFLDIPEDLRPAMPDPNERVFHFMSDRPGRGHLVGFPRRQWERAVRELGWTMEHPDPRLRGYRFHDLRHHFGSMLAQNDVPMASIRDALGHETIAMSERYSHLAPRQVAEAVNRLRLPTLENEPSDNQGL